MFKVYHADHPTFGLGKVQEFPKDFTHDKSACKSKGRQFKWQIVNAVRQYTPKPLAMQERPVSFARHFSIAPLVKSSAERRQ